MADLERVEIVDAVGQLLTHTPSLVTVQSVEDSWVEEAGAKEGKDEAAVGAVGAVDDEPALDLNEIGMGFAFPARLLKTLDEVQLRVLALAEVGPENLQGVEGGLGGLNAIASDQPNGRGSAEAKLVEDRVYLQVAAELVTDLDGTVATRCIPFQVLDIRNVRAAVDRRRHWGIEMVGQERQLGQSW